MTRYKQAPVPDELRHKLDGGGYHLTRQRVAVFNYLREVTHHPTAEEVYRHIRCMLPRVSLATVYKNLEALVDCGAISKLTYGDLAARYDVRTDHHYHSRCLTCGQIWDLEPADDARLLHVIAPQAGFRIKDYRLELLGYCQKCDLSTK